MNSNLNEEQLIQKGFNAGYQLQQHKPELAQKLQNGFTDKTHPYAQGFIAGSNEYVKEQSKAKETNADSDKVKRDYFNKIKEKNASRTKGKSKNRDKGIDL